VQLWLHSCPDIFDLLTCDWFTIVHADNCKTEILAPHKAQSGNSQQDTDINEVIDIILQRHIILVPVIDDKHKLIGLAGRPDILQQNLNQKFVTITEKRND
jgi:CBS-domain-containing membrane protein